MNKENTSIAPETETVPVTKLEGSQENFNSQSSGTEKIAFCSLIENGKVRRK